MKTVKKYNYQNFMIFFTFFLLWVSIQFGELVEDILAYILVISIGIIHGANDLLILSSKNKQRKAFLKNAGIYLGIIMACICIYLISPFLAIVLFILLSAYHFGEEHLGDTIILSTFFNTLYFLAYGLFIFSLLFYQSIEAVDEIMIELTTTSFTKFQIEVTLIASAIVLIVGSLYLIVLKKNNFEIFLTELFYLGLLFLVFNTSSLILGFAIYFIFWHSIPSIIHQIEFIAGNLNKKTVLFYVKKAMINWVISVLGLFTLYQFIPEIDLFATVVFVLLFAVTAPHAWVMYRMKN
jgi:Brp/Blh family beta-carotene 15,15'-monooxygenase